MSRTPTLVALSVAVASFAIARGAAAQAPPPAPATEKTAEFSAGAKLLLGGGLWTTPSDRPGNTDGVAYAGNAGGAGFGGGIYGEVRIKQYLGLEMDFLYDASAMQRDYTQSVNGAQVGKWTEKISMKTLRIPLLVKGVLPVPFGRMWLGLGPEFVLPQSADTSIDVKSGGNPGNYLKADQPGNTLLTFGLGFVIDLPSQLELPIDLRVSHDGGQPDSWLDRVSTDPVAKTATVHAQTTWDFRLALGLGYRF